MKKHKYIIISILTILILVSPLSIKAITRAELIQQIAEITQLIQQLQAQLALLLQGTNLSGIPSGYVFSNTLKYGTSSNEVIYLQTILNQDPETQVSSSGWGSPNNESMYFGQKTLEAVIKFQMKYKTEISQIAGYTISGTGYVGPATIRELNQLLAQYRNSGTSTPTPAPTPTPTPAPTPGLTTKCGDGIIQTPNSEGINEVCDTTKLNNQTCLTKGYTEGTLKCSNTCLTFDTSECIEKDAPPGGSLNPVNNPPRLNSINSKSVNEGATLTFSVSASDADGDILYYSVQNGPTNSSFNSTTKIFTFTPNYTQQGTYSVTFIVSDGKSTSSEIINITVNDVNVCVPTTCQSQNKNCGTTSDGCGGTLSCGSCSSGYSCSSNVCVQNTPTPSCGDGACNGIETCATCPGDCGTCTSGNTYYLDINNPSCSDNNPGTSSQPWCTLNRAYTWYSGAGTKVQEGDTVLFRNGSYGEFKEQSTQESTVQRRVDWVTYKAATGHTPILSKVYINNQDKWTPKVVGQTRIIFDGFSIQNGVNVKYTEYIQIKNCAVTLIPQSLMDMGYPSEGYNAPYVPKGSHSINTTYVSYVTISDCDVSAAEVAVYIGNGSNSTITGNNLHYLGENGIKFASPVSNSLMENNYIHNWNKRIAAEAVYGTISGTFAPNDIVTQAGTNAEGIVHSVYSGSISVYETLPAHFLDASDGGGKVTGPNGIMTAISLIDPPHTDGIGFQGSGVSGIVIRGNRIIGATTQGIKMENNTPGSMDDFLLENNLIYSAGQSLSVTGITNLRLINNTFMDDPSNGVQGARFSCSKGDTTITEMYNNIIDTFHQFGDSGSYTNRVVSHGNNIFNRVTTGGPVYPFILNSSEKVINDFNALFTNAAGNDYTLAAGSAAINFGNSAYASATDILGNPRVGAPDAGAYEYQGASPARISQTDDLTNRQLNNFASILASIRSAIQDILEKIKNLF